MMTAGTRSVGRQLAGDRLAAILARRAAVRAADLATGLGVSVPTLHRMLHDSGAPILVSGKARRTRYALRRPVRGDLGEFPLYAIDESGRVTQLTSLAPVCPQGCRMSLAGTDWPAVEDAREGWWEGLPYPLYDMRPQGYMGRQLARAVHRELAVPDDPNVWNDDDLLFVLSRVGVDLSGNLILGDRACERWQQDCLVPVEPLREQQTATGFAQLAEQALAAGLAGSSAAGEFPKFTALRELAGSATPQVLVKFSGADASPTVSRWADLLVCEHLALECARTLPKVASAPSRILKHSGRTFLEVERFDRHGRFGRSPLVSLETVNAALLGMDPNDWTRLADALVTANLLPPEDAESIRLLWWFGRLIANTDMHLGNLSFRPSQGCLRLAPAYDMLPMLYAPLPGGELPVRAFDPPLPLPRQRAIWLTACGGRDGILGSDGRGSAHPRGVSGSGEGEWGEASRACGTGLSYWDCFWLLAPTLEPGGQSSPSVLSLPRSGVGVSRRRSASSRLTNGSRPRSNPRHPHNSAQLSTANAACGPGIRIAGLTLRDEFVDQVTCQGKCTGKCGRDSIEDVGGARAALDQEVHDQTP